MDGHPFSIVIAPILGFMGSLGADQATKSWAMARGAGAPPPRWFHPMRCRHLHLDRPGAVPTLMGIAALLPILALWLPSPHATAAATAAGLAVGGATGNLLDQRRLGGVRDFVDIGLGAFNVADVAIVAGTFTAAAILVVGALGGA